MLGAGVEDGPDPSGPAAALQAGTGPVFDGLPARLRGEGLPLAEPASLFAVPAHPLDDPGLAPGDGPITPTAIRRDSGWPAGETPGGAWTSSGGLDRGPSARSIGSPPGSQAGSEAVSSEMIGEMASRLMAAAERLEQAALHLAQPAPGNPTSPPRPFRGRVGG
jgi:hypothetical protein